MSETLNLSTSHMSDPDLKAIAIYLKDQSAKEQATPTAPEQVTMNTGAQIYADECAGCHVANGKGATGLFPSLRGSPAVQQTDPTSLLRVVLRGARGVGTDSAPTAPAMPAFSWVLNDDQVAAVVTYIRNAWGNAAPAVGKSEVGKARRMLAQRTD